MFRMDSSNIQSCIASIVLGYCKVEASSNHSYSWRGKAALDSHKQLPTLLWHLQRLQRLQRSLRSVQAQFQVHAAAAVILYKDSSA